MLIIAFFVPCLLDLINLVISNEVRGEILFIMQIFHQAFEQDFSSRPLLCPTARSFEMT